ncbi:MAG: hypothetical protein NC347_03275 [Clostridium sp.]|nr:hypothetical protein [Clostridium sp.]
MATDIKISPYRRSGAKIFTSRDNGINARSELDLDALDQKSEIINVLIPSDTWSINPSFFGGLFEDSIKFYGDAFETHYIFLYNDKSVLNEALKKNIENNINYVRRSMNEGDVG